MSNESPASRFTGYRTRNASLSEHVNLRLSSQQLDALKEVAEAEGGLSLSDSVRLVLERGLRASRKGKQ